MNRFIRPLLAGFLAGAGVTLIAAVLSGCGSSESGTGVPTNPNANYPTQCQVYELGYSSSVMPNLNSITPSMTVGVAKLDFPQVQETESFLQFVGTAAENVKTKFALRCTTRYIVTNAGVHKFSMTSDDGSQMRINGILSINNDGPHGMTKKTSSPNLGVGTYTIQVDYFQNFGPKGLTLTVQEPTRAPYTL